MNIVEKYGGTSVGSIEQIQAIAKHVKEMREAGHTLIVVASAMGPRRSAARWECRGRSAPT